MSKPELFPICGAMLGISVLLLPLISCASAHLPPGIRKSSYDNKLFNQITFTLGQLDFIRLAGTNTNSDNDPVAIFRSSLPVDRERIELFIRNTRNGSESVQTYFSERVTQMELHAEKWCKPKAAVTLMSIARLDNGTGKMYVTEHCPATAEHESRIYYWRIWSNLKYPAAIEMRHFRLYQAGESTPKTDRSTIVDLPEDPLPQIPGEDTQVFNHLPDRTPDPRYTTT